MRKRPRFRVHGAKLGSSGETHGRDQATTALRNPAQLPTTFAILLSAPTPVDSPPGSFRPVLTPYILRPARYLRTPTLFSSLFGDHSDGESASTGRREEQRQFQYVTIECPGAPQVMDIGGDLAEARDSGICGCAAHGALPPSVN